MYRGVTTLSGGIMNRLVEVARRSQYSDKEVFL